MPRLRYALKIVVEMTQWETDEQLIWYEYGPELYLTVCQTGYVDEFQVLNEEKSKPPIISHSGVDVSTE